MDARQQEALVQRLVANPQDQAAIAEAHASGQQDPEGYAQLLEKVGLATPQASVASHWLNEAANVWLTTFQDPRRATNALLHALDRDPASELVMQRLAEFYGDDAESLAAAHQRRADAMAAFSEQEPDWRPQAAAAYESLGQLWSEAPLADVARAKAAYSRAIDLDPTSQFAIYNLRELHKAAGEFAEALPYFGMEVALTTDSERKRALLGDEIEVAKRAGRQDRAIAALREVLKLDPEDPGLRQKLGSALLERYRAGDLVEAAERREGCELFVGLAEQYPGEHGFLYALCGLELLPEHDRAVQLAIHFGDQLGRMPEVAPLAAAYVRDNPQGVMLDVARQAAGDAVPTAAPKGARAGASERPLQVVRPKPAARSAAVKPPDGVSVEQLLEQADEFAQRSRKNEAIATYRQVLDLDPVNPDALNYLLEVLTIKKKYADLRDVLLAAIEAPEAHDDDRLEWLRELAGVCESHVRDIDTAVYAWQRILEIDPDDNEAYDHVKRILEKARRWDQLAQVLRVESDRTEDVEASIAIERQLVKIHTTRRKDLTAAGEAWARIATLSPGDEGALQEAVRCFEKSERGDLAADTIAEHVAELDDDDAKRDLYAKLGALRVAQGQVLAAAEALEGGAETLEDAEMWGAAEDYFVQAQAWERAARAADEHAQLLDEGAPRARLLARGASHYRNVGEVDEAVSRLEKAVELAPSEEEYANSLEELLISSERVQELVQLFLTRAVKLTDMEARVHLRKRAAITQRDHMGDPVAARASFALVLQDAEDEETLLWLSGEAEGRDDPEAAVEYLRRLTEAVTDPTEKIRHCLHEAELHATKLVDVDAAAERYEHILELDVVNVAALEALGELEVARANHERAAEILERYIEATDDRRIKLEVASRLAELYELHLGKPEEAMRLLRFVHETDPDDLDATQRLCELAEASQEWSLVAGLMKELIAVEGDDEQISEMTRRLAQILHLQLSRGEEALDVLGKVADSGDDPCRTAFTELGDELGDKAGVAARLVSWFQNAPDSPEKSEALHGAFRRYVEAQSSEEAIAVATSLSQFGLADPEIAEPLERLAVESRDRAALALAHGLRVVELLPTEVGAERVRQAEVLVQVGAAEQEAIEHGELALADVERDELEPLLARLAALCSEAGAKIDVYERQIARFQSLEDRVSALVRAADVAADVGDGQRASSLFEAALGQGLESELLDQMVSLALAADKQADRKTLREILVEALAAGGQAARDGGRTRSNMLRLAAHLSHSELDDFERAFQYLGDALILHVEDEGLEALEDLAGNVGDYTRAETVLTRALSEVFDGPLVRRLLARRAALREERLDNLLGASEDLKQLHDLSPTDANVNSKLTALYEQLEDNQGLVNLLEDQILRSRDKEFRAELSRKVARLWQSELDDPREAADAWRRVIRLTKNDEEAKAGLAKAKEAMLNARRSDPVSEPSPTVAADEAEEAEEDEGAAGDAPNQDASATADADDSAADAPTEEASSDDSNDGTLPPESVQAAAEPEDTPDSDDSLSSAAGADADLPEAARTAELPPLDDEETTTSGTSMFDASPEVEAGDVASGAEPSDAEAPVADLPPQFAEGDFDALTEVTSNPGELLRSGPPDDGATEMGHLATGADSAVSDNSVSDTELSDDVAASDEESPLAEAYEMGIPAAETDPARADEAVGLPPIAAAPELAESIEIVDDVIDVDEGDLAASVPPPKPPPRRSATPPPPRVAPPARRSGLPLPPRRRAAARDTDK